MNVLDYVLPNYRYVSIAELNAVLKLYNITADRGSETSNIYKNNGLVYRILDGDGRKIGTPIKASLIYNKPTLKNIEGRFAKNDIEKQMYKRRVMNAIDFALLQKSNQSFVGLTQALQKEKIHMVLRQNDNRVIYGVTYVDHQTRCVFNGSQLGKQYSANALRQRCTAEQIKQDENPHLTHPSFEEEKSEFKSYLPGIEKVFEDLLEPEENKFTNEPSELRKFKKGKRKQKQSHN